MKYQIVIARYNEEIHHLEKYKEMIIVYNKGKPDVPCFFETISLPNIGRESHTYLYHIIHNYDHLAEYTFFRQGHMEDHNVFELDEYLQEKNFIGNMSTLSVRSLNENIKHYGKFLQDLKRGDLKKAPMNPYQWLSMIGLKLSMNTHFNMVWGANFTVSREVIHRKPKAFYEYLIQFVEYSSNPEEGHYFERGWYLIFEHPVFIKRKKMKILNAVQSKNEEWKKEYLRLKPDSHIADVHIWMETIEDADFENGMLYRIARANTYYKLHKNIFQDGNKFKVNTDKPIEIKIEFTTFYFTLLINHDKKCTVLFNGNIHVGTLFKQLNMDHTGISIRIEDQHINVYYINRVLFHVVLPNEAELVQYSFLSKLESKLYLDYRLNTFHPKIFETSLGEIMDKDIYRLKYVDHYPEFMPMAHS
jgi:hypothetical protein